MHGEGRRISYSSAPAGMTGVRAGSHALYCACLSGREWLAEPLLTGNRLAFASRLESSDQSGERGRVR